MTEDTNLTPTPAEVAPDPVPAEEPTLESYTLIRKSTRRAYSRCGWAVFAICMLLILVSPLLALLLDAFSQNGIDLSSFLEENILYLNELVIAVCILLSMLVLIRMPHAAPERRPISPAFFLVLFTVCIAIAFVGNIKSNLLLSVWSSFTGLTTQNDLTTTLTSIDVVQMILCTGIIAPFIEEFFFRKLLIDRLYRHGELTAILFSAIAFGLFHGNFNQLYYTLGVGLVFGYLYCRTGSYLGVTFLHMAFNLFSGVIPTLLLLEIPAEALENLTTTPSFATLTENLVPTLLYLFYISVYYGAVALGIVFFFVHLKKITVKKRETVLTQSDHTLAATVNSGVIAALVVLFLQLFVSLFIV